MDCLGAVHVPSVSRSKYGSLKGKHVRIEEGSPFWGHTGEVSEVDGERISVILQMLGANRVVTLPVGAVSIPGDRGTAAV